MKVERYGMILVVSGPSGSGKSTLCAGVLKEFAGLEFSVSCTTRAPRGGERPGVEYHFLTRKKFEEHIRNDDFLEYADVHGNYYGTLKSEVLDRSERGIDVLLDIDVQGALAVKKHFADNPALRARLETVFIAPPGYAELERRLRGRGTDAEESVARRLANARGEMTFWREYEYLLINADLAAAQAAFSNMIATFRRKSARYKEAPYHEC